MSTDRETAEPLTPEEEADVRRRDAEFRERFPYDESWADTSEGHRYRLLATLDAARNLSLARAAIIEVGHSDADCGIEGCPRHDPYPRAAQDVALPIMVHNEHTFGCIVCGRALPAPTLPALDAEIVARAVLHVNGFGAEFLEPQDIAWAKAFIREYEALRDAVPLTPPKD